MFIGAPALLLLGVLFAHDALVCVSKGFLIPPGPPIPLGVHLMFAYFVILCLTASFGLILLCALAENRWLGGQVFLFSFLYAIGLAIGWFLIFTPFTPICVK